MAGWSVGWGLRVGGVVGFWLPGWLSSGLGGWVVRSGFVVRFTGWLGG